MTTPLRTISSIILLLLAAAGCGGGEGSGTAQREPPSLAMFAGTVGTGTPAHADGTGSAAGFVEAGPIVADPAGILYVSEGRSLAGNHAVRKVTREREVSTLYRVTPDNVLAALVGIGLDAAPNVYVGYWPYCGLRCDPVPAEIRRIDASGNAATVPVTGSTDGTSLKLGRIAALARDLAGNTYIGDDFGRVLRLAPDGNLTTLLTHGAASEVGGIAIDDLGNVYTSHADDVGLIRRISPSGQASVLAQGPGRPMGIAVDAERNVYVAYIASHVVRKITPAGAISVVAGIEGIAGFITGPLPGVLAAPAGVAVSGSDLFITMGTGIAVIRNRP
jgi:sugar lactone lactonase YvrE